MLMKKKKIRRVSNEERVEGCEKKNICSAIATDDDDYIARIILHCAKQMQKLPF